MENSVEVALRLQLTTEDLLDLFRASRMKYLVWLLLVIGLVYSYLALAYLFDDGFSRETSWPIVLYASVAALAFGGAFFAPRIRVRQGLNSAPMLRGVVEYSVSARGVDLSSELASARYKWGAFYKVVETRKSSACFRSPFSATVIAKAT